MYTLWADVIYNTYYKSKKMTNGCNFLAYLSLASNDFIMAFGTLEMDLDGLISFLLACTSCTMTRFHLQIDLVLLQITCVSRTTQKKK
jgi:hypothetical protein